MCLSCSDQKSLLVLHRLASSTYHWRFACEAELSIQGGWCCQDTIHAALFLYLPATSTNLIFSSHSFPCLYFGMHFPPLFLCLFTQIYIWLVLHWHLHLQYNSITLYKGLQGPTIHSCHLLQTCNSLLGNRRNKSVDDAVQLSSMAISGMKSA